MKHNNGFQFHADESGWENRRVLPARKPPIKHKGGERWILGLLLGTILISAAFWFWGSLPTITNRFFAQNLSLNPTATPTPTPTPVVRKTDRVMDNLNKIVKDLNGTYGIFVFNLITKNSFSLNSDDVFTAASLIKLPVILTVYQEVEKGTMSLDDKYTFRQVDRRVGAGSMRLKPVGTIFTYRQMLQFMGQQSDNTAVTAFVRILGEKRIQTTIDGLGMKKTSFATNESTPSDIALFFRKLYDGNVVTKSHRDEILSFLTKTTFEERIPAGVPSDIRVAHKIGNEVGVFSDAGIVFANKPFVLVIMSKNILEKEALIALPQITKAVWEFEVEE